MLHFGEYENLPLWKLDLPRWESLVAIWRNRPWDPQEELTVRILAEPVALGACGFRGAFVNRNNLPYEDSPYLPDVTVADFAELADMLLG